MPALLKKNKKKEQRLRQGLRRVPDFLVAKASREWERIEKEAQKEEVVHRAKEAGITVGKYLLGFLLVAGLLSIAAVAPNIFVALDRLGGRRSFFHKKGVRQSLYYLKRKNYVATTGKGSEQKITLTSRGRDRALFLRYQSLRVSQSVEWDGMWRVLIFDVPERDKWARDELRRKLQEMGFYRLQDSVFVSPHPCRDELMFLTDLLSVQKCAKFIETSVLERDDDLRRHFGLA